MGLLLKDGRYLRLNLNGCYIDNRGVHVSYYQYESKEQRDIEQEVNDKFNRLVKTCSNYCENISNKLMNEINFDIEKIKSEKEFLNKLDENQKELLNIMHNITNNVNIISEYIFTRNDNLLKDLKDLEIFKELGYSEELLKFYKRPLLAIDTSGVLTNQKFTYNSMYGELKKLFKKDGYTEI